MSKKKPNKEFTCWVGHDLVNFLDHKCSSLTAIIENEASKVDHADMVRWAKQTRKDCKAGIKLIKSITKKF